MEKPDFEKLGLICGLECHQQLDTGKLFCRCPTQLRDDAPHVVVRRKLRAVASELGTFDPAALKEYKKDRSFTYEGYTDTTCEIEFDEHPPMSLDSEALEVAMKIALLLKADVVDEVQVMRKAVIDGSNTSGFQRSALFALNGEIQTAHGKVRIPTIAVEEDAARVIERKENEVVYRLDRLGIPLVEISTAPDIKTPEQARETALAIGAICRATGKAKRGLGTIRQDVNVSIKGGARVEIKGCQELDILDKYVENECRRQLMLLELKGEMARRGLKKDDFAKQRVVNVNEVFQAGKFPHTAFAVRLPKLSGLLGSKASGNNIRFGKEVSAYAKSAGVKGIMHSDELPAYGVTEENVRELRKKLHCEKEDAFALVTADPKTAHEALSYALERCAQALEGVPEETRNPLPEGFTEYARPLPGAARMYPETDVPPIKVSRDYLNRLEKELPLTAEQRVKLYTEKFKLSKDLAEEMKLSNWAPFFERMVQEQKCDATQAASVLLNELKRLKREGVKVEQLQEENLERILCMQRDGRITKELIGDALKAVLTNPYPKWPEVLKSFETASTTELTKVVPVIAEIVSKNKSLIEAQGERAIGPLMGDAMKAFKGKVDGKTISDLLRKEIAKVK